MTPTEATRTGAVDKALLHAHLGAQRRHVLGILEGLDAESLRRPVLPSGWSCLAMVRHLALDDERFWWRGVVAGEPAVIDQVTSAPEDSWQVAADATAEEILDLYRREIELADAVITTTSLDAPPTWWPQELFGGWRLDTVGEVMMHVITEVACHAGHLDAARELIDGRQWLVLED
jgi:uncharacterized damage-inducible protein DinB